MKPCTPLMSNTAWRRWVGAHPGRVYPNRGPCDTANAAAHVSSGTSASTAATKAAIVGGALAGGAGAMTIGGAIGWYLPGFIADHAGPDGSLVPPIPFIGGPGPGVPVQPVSCCTVATPPAHPPVSLPEPGSATVLAPALVVVVAIRWLR